MLLVDLANVSTGTWKILKFAKDPTKEIPSLLLW
jgi:hypothetical protein